jgi:uracil-DNA glycosylase
MMSREDVLRELELLPVWAVRNPPKLQQVLLEPAPIAEPVMIATVDDDAVIEVPVVEKITVEKIVKPWAFVCNISTAADECAILMSNIIQATQLALADYVLLPDMQALNTYQVTDVLLFGLDAAQSFLQLDVEDLRGKAHNVEGVRVWVSYHPEQMLQNPLLKREVWRDIQKAMPQLGK